ncbi:hypothetical protein NUW54_g14381 [Trametes sanguinea]|uniref:Uncharacterized protein n=1 Tax=Trametes sanguinea TaxID=158606 RepID=A0ACC1MCK4_9APHY|nr:hypothetical protein NUW54_g14381 [Trametes sanguinea]
MQLPTCTGLRIRSMSDAHVIFHAVTLGILPIVSRRLDIEERRYIHSGCVQLASNGGPTEGGGGLREFATQEFLYYQEKLPEFEADEELSALMCVHSPHSGYAYAR